MTHHVTRLARVAATLVLGAASVAVSADPSAQSQCSNKTKDTYGFVCHGFAQVIPMAGLEPIALVGTVTGSPTGVFEGYATLTASIGTVREHVRGQAVFQDSTCFGHIQYRVWIALPSGDGPELPPLDIDFATVSGGEEILGSPNNPGASGADVPRINCRLVKVKR
jgi:hypothetical protein